MAEFLQKKMADFGRISIFSKYVHVIYQTVGNLLLVAFMHKLPRNGCYGVNEERAT